MNRLISVVSVLLLVGACGSPSSLADAGNGGGSGGSGGSTGIGGGDGGNGTGGGNVTSLTEAQRVATFCEKTRLPGCAQWFSTQTECVDAMSRTQTDLCQAKWEAETDCLGQTKASDWVCAFAEPAIASTVCRDQYGFGAYCRLAVAKPACHFGACQYESDCASDSSCNAKTKHCFKRAASCGGLPCTYESDCPTNFGCNTALEQCVRR